MFDLGSTKLLLLGIIALLVVGPKELPGMLRTIGRYVGMIKRQAAEFRTQFDDAMKESELADLKKQVEDISREAETAVRDAETSIKTGMADIETEANKSLATVEAEAYKAGDHATLQTPAATHSPPETAEPPPASSHASHPAVADPVLKTAERAGA